MASIIILGAAGALGTHVAQQALQAGHTVSVVVRSPTKLLDAWRDKVQVHQADIAATPQSELAALIAGYDAVINTAGMVTQGAAFVALFAHIVSAIEAVDAAQRPVAWLLAGAGLLDIGHSGRRGVELPVIRNTYWPHAENFKRLQASTIDWRLLCPGPMVEGAAIGLERMRVSLDRLPIDTPALPGWLPGAAFVPVLASGIPQMIVPYADAAALMLGHLAPTDPMSRHRVGLALPPGMRGKKDQWTARP